MSTDQRRLVAETILSGKSILVCGSGVSTPAYPGVGALSDKFLELGAKGNNLMELADSYISDRGRESLTRMLRSIYGVWSSSRAHDLITMIPWRSIITTNYDAGLLAAYTATSRKNIPTIATEDEFKAWSDRAEFAVLHPHGAVLRPQDTYIISTRDYEEKLTSKNTFIDYVQEVVNKNHVFFLGFGLAEEYLIKSMYYYRDKNSPRGYFVAQSDYGMGGDRSIYNTLSAHLSSINIRILRYQNAVDFLTAIINSNKEIVARAQRLGLISGRGKRSYQLDIIYDTRISRSYSNFSMTAAIADNNVPTKTFYYNAAGSDAWLYLTTDERYIYIDSVKRIRDNVGQQIADAFLQYGDIIPDVICLGPGDCVKECIVINRITESAGGKLNDDTRLAVFLIDISLSLLSASVEHLKNNARVMCKIDIFPLCTEFERLKDHSNVTDRNRSNGLIMFGNTFGNFSNTTKIASELAAACNPGDLLVLELSLYDEITEEFLDALDMSYNIQPFKDYLGSPLRESNIDISHDEVKLRIENRDEILRQAKLGKVPKEIEVAGYYVPESNVRVGAITLPRGHERKIYTSKRFRRDYVIELMEANGFKFENEFSKGNATSFILLKYV